MYRGQICNLDTLSLLAMTIGYLLAFHICHTYRSMSSLLLPVRQANRLMDGDGVGVWPILKAQGAIPTSSAQM